MRRSGFTMIELIFVIVILGILAAIALPRFGGVQDDALVANEKAGISAVRSGLTSIRGRAIVRGTASDMNISITDKDGKSYKVQINGYKTATATAETGMSQMGFPNGLSVSGWTTDPLTTARAATGDAALAIVLEPGSRDQWQTEVQDTNKTKITGPASKGVTDESAEIYTNKYWLYQSDTGTITLQ